MKYNTRDKGLRGSYTSYTDEQYEELKISSFEEKKWGISRAKYLCKLLEISRDHQTRDDIIQFFNNLIDLVYKIYEIDE